MNKLIVCSPQLGIAPESNSGGEVYDREVIKSLCDQEIKVIVILPKNKPYLRHKNLKVYYLPIPFVWPPYFFNLFIIPYLFWIYKKEKFNILRVHSPYFVGLGAIFFHLFYRHIPLVVTYHHLEENKPIFDLINRFAIKFWDHLISVSAFTKQEIIEKYGLEKNKISVIYNGIAFYFKPQKKRKDLIKKYNLGNNKILLFLGGLKYRKNVAFLIRLIARLKIDNCKLLICGSGHLRNKLENLSRRLGTTDKVVFTGFIKETNKVDFYNLADIFLFPSLKEGFGMPVIEAAACGVLSIAARHSSLPELIIDGKTGCLAKFNDINDWKLKIEKLLKNEDLRKKIGKEAQNFSKQFTWEKTVSQQVKIYNKLLEITNPRLVVLGTRN